MAAIVFIFPKVYFFPCVKDRPVPRCNSRLCTLFRIYYICCITLCPTSIIEFKHEQEAAQGGWCFERSEYKSMNAFWVSTFTSLVLHW